MSNVYFSPNDTGASKVVPAKKKPQAQKGLLQKIGEAAWKVAEEGLARIKEQWDRQQVLESGSGSFFEREINVNERKIPQRAPRGRDGF